MSNLCCGFAQEEITPCAPEVFMDGYGHRTTPAEGIRDPLYVKAFALKTGGDVFVIVSFDLCGFNRELKDRLRGYIAEFTQLPAECFAICATHTHAGPVCGILPGLPLNYLYYDRVGLAAARVVKNALANACEGTLRFGFGRDLTLSFNRRGRSDIDRRVHVCAFYDNDNRLCGVLSTANCHAVCNTDMNISADYPAILYAQAAEKYPGVPFLFLQGRGADIDPHFTNESRTEMYEKLGKEFANSVFYALDEIKSDDGVRYEKIRSLFCPAEIPFGQPDREKCTQELGKWKKALEAAPGDAERRYPAVEFMWNKRALDSLCKGEKQTIRADFEMLKLGTDAAFVFAPFEILTPTGNRLEAMLTASGISPEKAFVFGYSNGTNGYLTPHEDCGSEGYENGGAAHWYGLPECCAQTETAVLEQFGKMNRELMKN